MNRTEMSLSEVNFEERKLALQQNKKNRNESCILLHNINHQGKSSWKTGHLIEQQPLLNEIYKIRLSYHTEGPVLNVSIHRPYKAEIMRALKQPKSGKGAGPDGPPEPCKINRSTTAEMLRPLFLTIWEADKVPSEWKHGYLVTLPKKGIFM